MMLDIFARGGGLVEGIIAAAPCAGRIYTGFNFAILILIDNIQGRTKVDGECEKGGVKRSKLLDRIADRRSGLPNSQAQQKGGTK